MDNKRYASSFSALALKADWIISTRIDLNSQYYRKVTRSSQCKSTLITSTVIVNAFELIPVRNQLREGGIHWRTNCANSRKHPQTIPLHQRNSGSTCASSHEPPSCCFPPWLNARPHTMKMMSQCSIGHHDPRTSIPLNTSGMRWIGVCDFDKCSLRTSRSWT